MTILRSDGWSNAHLAANDHVTRLLNLLRDHGYNPSQHLSYDRLEQHVMVEESLLEKHPDIAELYAQYVQICQERAQALERIQSEPKIDLGF